LFAKPTTGGNFFKPADHMNDLGILIEPKKVLKDQAHVYEGIHSTRDVGIADIAVFRNSADVETATPSLIIENAQITNQVLVADIERNDWVGKVALVVIRKAGRAYVYREPEHPGVEEAAQKYYEAREAEAAANLDDFPMD